MRKTPRPPPRRKIRQPSRSRQRLRRRPRRPQQRTPPAPAQAETPAAPAGNEQAEQKVAADAKVAPGTPSKDEQACLQAVSTKTNNGDVTTLSVEPSEANTLVMVGVGPNRAPWKCLVSGGVVAEVSSMTDEGNL